MNIPTEKQIEFLRKISTGDWLLKNNEPGGNIKELIDAGYCKTSKARSGPLGLYTGALFIVLTDCCKNYLALLDENAKQK